METETIIPLFEPNQILSSTHLNQLREYLDNETRYSRIKLSGVGITCGLHLQSISSSAIVVTTGYGITTDGFLLDLADKHHAATIRYTRYQPYVDPSSPAYNFGKSMATDSRWHESYGGHQEPLPKKKGVKTDTDSTKPLEESTVQPEIFELFTDEKTDYDKDARLLSLFDADSKMALNLVDMAIVYLVEFDDEDLKSCTGANCDNKGKRRDVTLRMLLVPASRLFAYANKDFLYKQNALRYLEIPRMKNTELTAINSLATLQSTYTNAIIDKQAENLRTALQTAFTSCSYLLALTGMNVTEAVHRLTKGHVTYIGKDTTYVQYAADALHDATQSYNEFVDAMWLFFRACGKSPLTFPRHLTLGRFAPGKTKVVDEFRTVFFNSPPEAAQDVHLENARSLFNKTLKLILSFQDASQRSINKENIRLTPDLTQQQPFSDRSIPYYYDATQVSELVKLWNTDKTIRGKEAERYGYFATNYSAPVPFSDPFAYSTQQSPMLRIEGIAGVAVTDAKTKLESLRTKYNLNFGIRLLRLDNAAQYYEADAHCELNDLHADYLLVREEVICCVLSLYNFLVQVSTQGLKDKFKLKLYGGNLEKEKDAEALILAMEKTEKLILTFFTVRKELFENVCKSLPADFRDFDYGKFLYQFKLLQHASIGYRVLLEQTGITRKDLLRNMEVTFHNWFEESELWRIIERLRALNCQCTYPKLGILAALRNERLKKKKESDYFPNFINANAGVEHFAGVPVGGTFCLVYSSAKIFSGGPEQQVVADFALNGSCCGVPCLSDRQDIDQPIVAMYDEITIDADDKETDPEKGVEIDVLRNDYYIDKPAVAISEAVSIHEEEVKDSKNTGKISIDKKNGRSVVIYKGSGKTAVTDVFLLRITDEKTGAYDYSTLVVNVTKAQNYLINTKPDHAATLAGKKVNIDVLVNDKNQTTMEDVQIILVDKDGKEYKPGEACPTAKGNVAIASDKKSHPTVVFDAEKTSQDKNKEVITDTFRYILRDKNGNFSLPTTVEVDILPCCDGKVKFSLPKLTFCRNEKAVPFTIDVPGGDAQLYDITGPGASKAGSQWMFNPASTEINRTPITLSLIYRDTKQQLATLSVNIHPLILKHEARATGFKVASGNMIVVESLCDIADGQWIEWFVQNNLAHSGTERFLSYQLRNSSAQTLKIRMKVYYKTPSIDPECFQESELNVEVNWTSQGNEAQPEVARFGENLDLVFNEKFKTAVTSGDTKLATDTAKVANTVSRYLLDKSELIKLKTASKEALITDASGLLNRLNTASGNVTDPDPSAKKAVEDVYKSNTLDALHLVVASSGTTKPSETTTAALTNISAHLTGLSQAGKLTTSDLQVVDKAILDAKGNATLTKSLTELRKKL